MRIWKNSGPLMRVGIILVLVLGLIGVAQATFPDSGPSWPRIAIVAATVASMLVVGIRDWLRARSRTLDGKDEN
ncbi:hypothetical protein ACIBGM_06590 [Kribbella sp. NPDC050470]|uniref:hypothetical protein n=1 Tax=Kribbella sp. NPDC050470 TaxID=3364117 RepID=UPI0037AD2E59